MSGHRRPSVGMLAAWAVCLIPALAIIVLVALRVLR